MNFSKRRRRGRVWEHHETEKMISYIYCEAVIFLPLERILIHVRPLVTRLLVYALGLYTVFALKDEDQ